MPYVYQHIRLDNNTPFYIGVGTSPKRAYSKYGRNTIWKRIAYKHGYTVEVVIDNISRDQALQEEKRLILLYGRINNKTGILSNMTDGGDGGSGIVWTEEAKSSLSLRYKERCRVDRSMIEPMQKSNKGRKMSEETKRKMSITKTGKKLTEEHKAKLRGRPATSKRLDVRDKISKSLKGRPVSEERRRATSETLKGRSNGPWSEEQRRKNLDFWLLKYSPVAQYDLEDNLIRVWNNRTEASIELGIKKETIRSSIRFGYVVNGFKFKKWLQTANPVEAPSLNG